MHTPDVSIVFVNWKAAELTRQAVQSLVRHTAGVTYEIIAVDNTVPPQAELDQLPAGPAPVTVLKNGANAGFSAASNQGMRVARGRYVLLLNTDTIQRENAVGAAAGYMDAHPEVGALGIRHLNADLTDQRSAFPFPSPWAEIAAPAGRAAAAPAPPGADTYDADWLCGSFLMIRRECLEEVGLLDERFFTYAEDIDWCLRARRAGWRVRYWGGASMVHLGAASQPFIRDKTFLHLRSQLQYYRKHHGAGAAAAYYLAMLARMTAATGVQAGLWLLGRTPASALRERWERQARFARQAHDIHGAGPPGRA
jgi:GT2 family glycosyltransferase